MRAPNSLVLAAIILAAAQVACLAPPQYDTRPSFSVPNPFKELERRHEQDVRTFGEYYSIKSTQTVLSNAKKSTKTNVEEYFSLASGLSLSIHKHQNEKDGDSWALLSDGPNGKSYIVRNPDETDPNEIDCELDHSHEHRHVFPWQYEYNIKTSVNLTDMETIGILPAIENGQIRRKRDRRRKKKNTDTGKSPRVAIYGVSAVWLNAIERDIKSNLIGDHSSYPKSNSWVMDQDDLWVELIFEKLSGDGSKRPNQEDLDKTTLESIKINRKDLIEKTHDDPEGLSSTTIDDYIVVTGFQSGLKVDQIEALKLMQVQLSSCRRSNKKHRVFPSVMREMSQSPQRMFHLQYIERKYARFDSIYANKHVNHLSSGEYDESRHRYVFPHEFVTEVFSLKAETQVTIYDPLPVDGVGPGYGRTDVFMKKFTERSEEVRSSRHSTVHYHLIEDESEVTGCKVGEMEPIPKQRIFYRQVHFHRSNGVRLSGHLTGLGALLLNVADIHYKSFGLFRRKINVYSNPYRMDEVRRVKVDEWRVDYKQSGWRIHLFFERLNSTDMDEKSQLAVELDDEEKKQALAPSLTALNRGDVSRLVRVDIRDLKTVDTSDGVIEDSDEDRRDDYDLVAQFDIVKFNFEMPQETFDHLTTVPMGVCTGEEPNDDSSDDDDDSTDYYHNNDYYNNFHGSDEDTDDESVNKNDKQHLIDQIEAENFEEGQLNEDYEMPDLFEFIDGQPSYEITSRLEILPDDDEDEDDFNESAKPKQPPATKYIWLRETVDLDQEVSTINLYKSHESFTSNEPFERYYINYNSEAVFHITKSKCQYQEDVNASPWLRLFSKDLHYSVAPNLKGKNVDLSGAANQPVLIQSNRLRLYGLGALWQRSSGSMFTQFLGRRHQQVVDEKDSNIKYNQLVWSDEDQSELRILYNFMQTVSDDQKPGDKAHHSSKIPSDMLHLDSIEVLNSIGDFYVTSFKSIKAKILSVVGREPKMMFVPEICKDSLIEMRRLRNDELTEADVQPPTFSDLIKESGSYSALYSVNHKVQVSEESQTSRTIVHEDYDHKNNRGKIVITSSGKIETEVFIEGGAKKMFAYNAQLKLCKQISQLKSLVDLGPLMEPTEDAAEFEFDKKFGLSGLWTALAQQKSTLKIETQLDARGHKFEQRTYSFRVKLPNKMKFTELQVELVFRAHDNNLMSSSWKLGDVKQRSQGAMFLKQINVISRPPAKSSGGLSELNTYSTSINVLDLGRLYNKWDVPEPCKRLMSESSWSPTASSWDPQAPREKQDNSNQQPGKDIEFPQIDHLMSPTYQFHMKSEVSIRNLDPTELPKFYMLDEWTHNNHLRVKLTSLGSVSKKQDFEFILYSLSQEVFDISTPYQCPLSLPNSGLARDSPSNLVAFWSDRTPLINHLSQTFYGPLSLWLLAQKNLDDAKLSSSIDIAPMPGDFKESAKDALAKLEKELRSESWIVKLPVGKDKGDLNPTFDMTFAKWSRTNDDGSTQEWRTLQSIKVNDRIGNDQFEVFVDVVNYNYAPTSDDVVRRFALPLGWGCRRDELQFKDIAVDDFQLDSELDVTAHELTYEASLEVFDVYQPSKGRKLSPPISGTYYQGHASYKLPLISHQARIKYPNGNTLATKTVFDTTKNLVYHIDRITGFCSISLDAETYWMLDFPLGEPDNSNKSAQQHESIILTSALFRDLFLDTPQSNKFSLVNQYSMEGGQLVETSYEYEYRHLFLSSNLEGPASVVRTYRARNGERPVILTSGKRPVRLHDLVSVRVLVFTPDKSEVKGQLDIAMHHAPRVDLSQLLAETNIVQCFNDGDPNWDRQLASFTLEYPLDLEHKIYAYQRQAEIRDEFYEMMITKAGVTPLQLDGRARVEFESHDDIMRVHFNVLDIPPAHIYFNEVSESTIPDYREEITETKLVPSVVDCSRWCDQLNCIAMSHCDATKLCQIIREDAIDSLQILGDRDKYLEWVTKLMADRQCTYYYRRSNRRAMNLERFTRMMDEEINSPRVPENEHPDEQGLHVFSILVRGDPANPMRFAEEKDKFRWEHEDRDRPSEGFDLSQVDAKDHLKSSSELVLATLKSSAKLDLSKLSTFDQEQNAKYLSTVVGGQDHCVEQCATYNCLLLHYNKRTRECGLISLGPDDEANKADDVDHLSKLKQLIVPAERECSVKIIDFLDKFSKFPTTMAPMNYGMKLEDVSAMECALMCQHGHEKCLSFDYCSVLNDRSGEPSSYCYLQKTHITLGTFDKSKLILPFSSKANNSKHDRQVNCDHYSKAVLEDFKRLRNRKLATRLNVATRGVNAENCAIDCMEDEDCWAFEYCYNDFQKPAQACYFVRQRDILKQLDELDPDEQVDVDKFGKQLVESNKCSVYVPRRLVAETKLGHGYHSLALLESVNEKLAPSQSKGFTQSLPVIVFYLLMAVIAGAIIQFAYIKLMGRPVELFSNSR